MTIPKELRAIAMTCVEPTNREMLRRTADRIDAATWQLHADPCDGNMTALNGLWSLAHRMIKAAKAPPQPPAPKSDILNEAATLQRMAA